MSDQHSFLSLAISGGALVDEIDDYVDRWHANPDGQALHDYLDMNRDDYALWLGSPDSLSLIIASRKLRKPLDVIANDNLRSLRLASVNREHI